MLGIWMYSWDLVDWQPADPPVMPTPAEQPPARRSNEGGGGSYEPLGEDYWLAREGQLTPVPRENTPDIDNSPGPLLQTQQADAVTRQIADQYDKLSRELQKTLVHVARAKDKTEKMQLAAAAMQLSLDISKLRKQYYDRARSIRLLDVL